MVDDNEGLEIEVQTLPGMEGALNSLEEAQLRAEEARRIFEACEDPAPWMNDYWDLIAEGWSWRQAIWMVWMSLPRDRRKPATQQELATEVLGLTSDRVIRRWRESNPAIDLRIQALSVSLLTKQRAEILRALVESAANPSYRHHQDRKLALEMLGDYVPKQAVAVGVLREDEIAEASTDELRALVDGGRVVSEDDAPSEDLPGSEEASWKEEGDDV